MFNKMKIFLQDLLPKKSLTKLVGYYAEYHCSWRWLTHLIIRLFIYIYKINMQEAAQSDITKYSTFNDFFSRALCNGARPVDANPNVLVSPVDGIVSQFGFIDGNSIFQSKGHYYNLEALLAGDSSIVSLFYNGIFSVIYLSPKDYHRVHMPYKGVLCKMLYVPGDLYSVNLNNVSKIPNLFARNERVICLFDTSFGFMAQILIGATIVGSIETVWAGPVIPPHYKIIKQWYYPLECSNEAIILLKGQEMGRFKLGSTVINLFVNKNLLLGNHLYIHCAIKVGQPLAYIVS